MFKKKCTSKIKYQFIKYASLDRLAKEYVKQDKHNRAVKTFNDSETARVKFWDSVYSLYPALKGKDGLRYDITINEIVKT